MQNLRDAFRALRAAPAVSAVAILSLALGIGANTAVFSLVDTLLLKSLPVREPERLATLEQSGDRFTSSWTNVIWEQIRDREGRLFEGATAWSGDQFDLSQGGEARFVDGLYASGRFFDVFGVPAILGRTFAAADDRRGGGPDGAVAVISYRFWQRQFGGAADAIGRRLTLNRVPFTVIGVMPRSFTGPSAGEAADVVIPIGCEPLLKGAESLLDHRGYWWLTITVRLKPGQTRDEVAAALRGEQRHIRDATLPSDWPPRFADGYLRAPLILTPAASGVSFLRSRYQQPLLVIMAIVAVVLLIACANLANLMLARAAARRHELSVRLALGASRGRLARQLLAESLLLASAGALLGLLFARWSARLLVHQISTWRETVFLDLAIDWRVLAFTAAVATATALLFGVAPAWFAARAEPNDALKSQGRALAAGRRALWRPLVVLQVTLSLVLLVAAGLFMRTFARLSAVDLGFDGDAVLVVTVDASGTAPAPAAGTSPEDAAKASRAARASLVERAADAVAQVPGVARAAVSVVTPLSNMSWQNTIEVPGAPAMPERERNAHVNFITPGWFATYGTRLVAGRDFDARDRLGSPAVVIVNQAFARKFFPGREPLGRSVGQAWTPGNERPAMEVVGIVQDAVYRTLRDEVPPTMYLPLMQAKEIGPSVNLSVRSAAGSPGRLTRSVADALTRVHPGLSLTFRPLAAQIDASLTRERILAILSGFFGALALLLAGLGLYGVTSYAVARQRTEIGIRMALGADAAAVVRGVVGRAAVLVVAGIALGAAISLWASKFVAALLYGLEPRDAMTLGSAAAALAAIGALAAWLPARRAAGIDPARVLREG